MVFSEDDAQQAWDDLMSAEPCIYISSLLVVAEDRIYFQKFSFGTISEQRGKMYGKDGPWG